MHSILFNLGIINKNVLQVLMDVIDFFNQHTC